MNTSNLHSKDEALHREDNTEANFFSRWVDGYIPNTLLNDPAQVFQARTLIVFTLVLSSLALLGISFVFFIEQTLPVGRIITISLVACLPLSITILRKTESLRASGLCFIFLITLTVAYIDSMNRSIDGPMTVLWILPYTMSAMLLGSRQASYVGIVSISILIANIILLELGKLPSSLSNPENWKWLRLITFVVVLTVVAVCTYGLTRLERRRQRELSEEIEFNKEVMNSLTEATQEARVAARSKELFLATMSHELRTPLNGVLGNAQLLAKEVADTQAKERVENITASGELLLSIINDVLDLSKFESQGVSLNPAVFDLSNRLHQLYRMIKPRIAEGVDFIIDGAGSSVFVNTDANRLSQVVLNLLSNAAKFTEQGSITLSMEVLEGGEIKIQISDTGSGISKENQQRLFQNFVQVGDDAHKHIEGTGLGLAITKKIVERMDGSIQLESALGEGTSMSIFLPIEVVSEPVEDSVCESEQSTDVLSDLSNLRILIVDDVDMNCMMLEGMLEALEVQACEIEKDGSLAVERIKQDDNFDLILMDVRMPIMDGLEATRQIRNMGYSKPIVAVTANAFEEDKDDCLTAGMNDFLAKPIELEALQKILREVTS